MTSNLHRYLSIVACLLTTFTIQAQPPQLDSCNVVWTTQSQNSAGSMPCGGGDIGLNIWVEKGDVFFYIARSGTFDENNQMLKLGRVRLQLSSHPFDGTDFKQELQLAKGSVMITGGKTRLHIWVDVFRPVIHVQMQSTTPQKMTASYETWRYTDHLITDARELRANSYKVLQAFPVITYQDSISFSTNGVLFYHRNRDDRETVFDYTVRKEGLDSLKSKLYDPLLHNTFGGMMQGEGMQPVRIDSGVYTSTHFKAWVLESSQPVRAQALTIALNVVQTPTQEAWKQGLDAIIQDATHKAKKALQKSEEWWQQFWSRSYIFIDSNDSGTNAVSRNYQLFRYQLGCNAYSKWPTKFNGGLFTFDPVFVNEQYPFSADFRLWGGGTMTAQNQRLVYDPMLKSGDFDMLQPQFDFYLNALTNAELRTRAYWHHNGASFTEQIENFGLPNIAEYGIKRPAGYDPGMEYNAWLEYDWESSFEFCLMMLDVQQYEGRDISSYIPFIESCLRFYDEHYQYLANQRGSKTFDQDGKYILYPGSALETFKMTYNSTTTICALTVILNRLLALPAGYLTDTARQKWTTMLQRIPAISFREYEGHTTIAPAQAWQRIQNSEAPQLYPVFPWGIYGVGKPGLDTAINTWRYDPHVVKYRSHIGWKQYNIFAARLGLVDEAAYYTTLKFSNGNHRFPTFWGPGFDWTPDHNWGGSAMIGLQEMLLQTDDRKIYLLPAWPKNWNATFKLHAPYNTIVEGVVKDGKLVNLLVTPQSRAVDVVAGVR